MSLMLGNLHLKLARMYSMVSNMEEKAKRHFEEAIFLFQFSLEVPTCFPFKVLYNNLSATYYEYAHFLSERDPKAEISKLISEANKYSLTTGMCRVSRPLEKLQKMTWVECAVPAFAKKHLKDASLEDEKRPLVQEEDPLFGGYLVFKLGSEWRRQYAAIYELPAKGKCLTWRDKSTSVFHNGGVCLKGSTVEIAPESIGRAQSLQLRLSDKKSLYGNEKDIEELIFACDHSDNKKVWMENLLVHLS